MGDGYFLIFSEKKLELLKKGLIFQQNFVTNESQLCALKA